MTKKTLFNDAMANLRYGEACDGDVEAIRDYVLGLTVAVDAFLIGDADTAKVHLDRTGYDLNEPLRSAHLVACYKERIAEGQL